MTMTKHLHIKDFALTLVLTLITRLGCKNFSCYYRNSPSRDWTNRLRKMSPLLITKLT